MFTGLFSLSSPAPTRAALLSACRPASAVSAALALTLCGCGDLLVFPVEAEVQEFTVPGNPYLHHDGAPIQQDSVPPVELSLNGSMPPGKVALSHLELILTETAIDPQDDQDDLVFLTGVDVYMQPIDPASGLPALKIAEWTGPAEPGADSVTLNVTERYDLSQYLQVGFRLDIRTRGVVPYDDVSLRGIAHFEVNPI